MAFYNEGFGNVDTEPDYIYYNASIVNNRITDSGQEDPTVGFNENRQQPIVKDSSKYNFTITRFTCNGTGLLLPMFIPQIQVGQSDPTLTVYSITMELSVNIGGVPNSYETRQYIHWVPQFTDESVPKPPIESQEIANSRYYWCMDYTHWLKLVNNTYEQCLTDLQAQVTVDYPVYTLATQAPRMIRDPTTNLFSVYYDTYGFGGIDRLSIGTTADEDFIMYCNSNFWGLFSNFENNYIGNEALNNGKEYELTVRNILGQNIASQQSPSPTAPAPTTKYYVMTQDYPSTSNLWSPIASIVFTTNLIPIQAEQTSEPISVGTDYTGTVATGSNFSNIITDIALPLTNAHGYKEFLEYIPSAQYRMVSLAGSNTPIQNVDVRVYFKLRLSNELVPLKMFNLSSVEVKVLFVKKGLGHKVPM